MPIKRIEYDEQNRITRFKITEENIDNLSVSIGDVGLPARK